MSFQEQYYFARLSQINFLHRNLTKMIVLNIIRKIYLFQSVPMEELNELQKECSPQELKHRKMASQPQQDKN
jgi:hypothetical protein